VGRPACSSGLGAALQLTPLASAVCLAVASATCNNPLGAARQLTQPPAHGTPPGSLHGGCRPNPTPALRHSQPSPTPLSALNDPLVHTGHHKHDGGSAGAGQTLGSACLGQDGQQRLGGGRTVGVKSGGVDRGSSALSNPRFAGCSRVVPLLQTLMAGSNTRATPHRCTASTARRRDTLECACCCSEGV
jgi:hypothetical protein